MKKINKKLRLTGKTTVMMYLPIIEKSWFGLYKVIRWERWDFVGEAYKDGVKI